MPEVTLQLYAGFRKYVDGESLIHVAIEPNETIEQMIAQFGVPVQEVRIVFCNNRLVDLAHRLSGGETIGIFPAIGGG